MRTRPIFRPLGLALVSVAAAGVLLQIGSAQASSERARQPAAAATKQQALDAYGKLPLAFVPNAGQTDARVRFEAQAGAASFFFTPRAVVFSLARKRQRTALRLGFLGTSPTSRIEGERLGPGRVNYLIGRDPAKWHTGLRTYHQLVYRGLWPGIDLRLRGVGGTLKYEFLVRPGARVDDIRLAYRGASGLRLTRGGALLVGTSLGVLRDRAPRTYQRVGGRLIAVPSRFALAGKRAYGFAVGRYDAGRALVIDPGLTYSTYLGGAGREFQGSGLGLALDSAGSVYVSGGTNSADFPTTPGAFDRTLDGVGDGFVTKLNPAGSALVYSTFLGGSSSDGGHAIAVDSAGNAYVMGNTQSTDFPTTAGAFDTTFNGTIDAFVTKLNATGSALAYSTFLGGAQDDLGFGIAVDVAGNAYTTGLTASPDFPTTPGAFDTTFNGGSDAYVTELSLTGSALVYSTFLGGSSGDIGARIAVDSTGNAYVVGQTGSPDLPTTSGAFDTTYNGGPDGDVFVTKLNAIGSALVYSTYLGGSQNEPEDATTQITNVGLALDSAGSVYVSGGTNSADFPTTPGAFDRTLDGVGDGFVTKLNPAGSALVYSTFLGGASDDQTLGVALDPAGIAYVTGSTRSPDFPTTPGAFDTTWNGGNDAFVTELNVAGSALVYSTFLGGALDDEGFGIALDSAGNAYLNGLTASVDFLTTPGAFDTTCNGRENSTRSSSELQPTTPPPPPPPPPLLLLRLLRRRRHRLRRHLLHRRHLRLRHRGRPPTSPTVAATR